MYVCLFATQQRAVFAQGSGESWWPSQTVTQGVSTYL